MILENYVSIMVIYHPFINYDIYQINRIYSRLDRVRTHMCQYTINANNILPITILASLVTFNSSVTAFHIEVIAYIKFQLNLF